MSTKPTFFFMLANFASNARSNGINADKIKPEVDISKLSLLQSTHPAIFVDLTSAQKLNVAAFCTEFEKVFTTEDRYWPG